MSHLVFVDNRRVRVYINWGFLQGRSEGRGQVEPAHPRILLAHPRIKVKHIKNKIHLQYLSIICLWFKIWPNPAKNHCYALGFLARVGQFKTCVKRAF
jgi:hypothetical protein